MQEAEVASLLREAILLVAKIAGPPLGVGLVVGVVISVIQAVTQVNEQSLPFLAKAAAIFGVMLLLGSSMMASLNDFTRLVMDRVAGLPM